MKRLFSFILSLVLCTVALASATNRKVVNAASTTVEQVTHYYPYGGVIGDISAEEECRQKYKFEGKELDRSFGLDNYDIHARNYYAMLPMWDRVDPLAEKYYGISPYVYCGGDPVNRGDYDGRDILDIAAGFIIGFGTDIIPGTGFIRDSYSPNDKNDYNQGLRSGDAAASSVGTILMIDGARNEAIGVSTASVGGAATLVTAGVGTPVSAPIAGTGAAIAIAGTAEIAAGAVMMANSEVNKKQGYDRGAPPANNGYTKTPHGGAKHDNSINNDRTKLPKEATDVRKNQCQVDVNGNKVGNNRPDLSYTYKGKRYNIEFDNSKIRMQKHEKTLIQNDPNAINILNY